jgi:hypothetical protein
MTAKLPLILNAANQPQRQQLASSDLSDISGYTTGSFLWVSSGVATQDNANLFYNPSGYASGPTAQFGPRNSNPLDAGFEFYVASGVTAHFHDNNTSQSSTGGVSVGLMYVPTGAAVASGSRVGQLQFGGSINASDAIGVGAGISVIADDNYSSSGLGSHILIQTCPSGSTTLTTAVTISDTQVATFANTIVGSINGNAATATNASQLNGQSASYYLNASNLSSGTVPATQMPALTGAVTTVAGTVATSLSTSQSAAITWSGLQTFKTMAMSTASPAPILLNSTAANGWYLTWESGGNIVAYLGNGTNTAPNLSINDFGIGDGIGRTGFMANNRLVVWTETGGTFTLGASIAGLYSQAISASTTPTGTGGASGSIADGTYYAKIVALDAAGGTTSPGGDSTPITLSTGGIGSIAWAWTQIPGAVTYQIWVGASAGGENSYFTSRVNSYTQTTTSGTGGTMPGSNTSGRVASHAGFDAQGSSTYRVNGTSVLGPQQTGIGATISPYTLTGTYATDLSYLQAAYNQLSTLVAALKNHGMVAT